MRKGFCKNGHDFREVRTRLRKDGSRECVPCRNIKKKEWADANRDQVREYDRIYGQAKRAGLGAKPSPNRVGKGMAQGRPKEPTWHNRLPVEPIRNWLEQRAKDWDLDDALGNNHAAEITWEEQARRLGVNVRRINEIMHGHQAGVSLDIVDRMLLEAGEMEALELMYPLEGLRETAGMTKYQSTPASKARYRRRKAARARERQNQS